MKKIRIIIERSEDMYGAYSENVNGIWGGGDTVAEAKQSILEAIELTKQNNVAKNIPAVLLGEYTLEYKYDIQSLLNYYKGIFSNTALERLTGINQKQLHHYATGLKKPRPAQKQKIENGLHNLANELLAVHL